MRVSLPLLVLGAGGVVTGCTQALHLAPSDAAVVLAQHRLDAPDPGQPGPHPVHRLYYGSGTDRRRAEYRDSVTIRTDSVDATPFIDLGDRAKDRNRYWGFTPEGFPLNGRVWYPEGDGPFPLVLIVHGNHNPRDFSDPGYGYLGELLASRGYIVTSVDMNFVNGGIRGENDARGWLLLKHLEAWRGFNADTLSPFHRRVDLDRVALVGHSRGGEAVGHAAAFNTLSRYPDDANVTFDFGFGIRAIIAIAPVDGQYRPTDRFGPVENVNYLVFHGSHDGDVTSFHGLRLYHRLRFTDGGDYFKSAVYVYRANHGQWNTVWGNKDNGPRSGRRLALRALIDGADQRRFAEVYVSAFLDATVAGHDRYLPLFRDHRAIGDWLPPTMYVTRFTHSGFVPLATFEEDIDVTTGTAPQVSLEGDSLATWREARLMLRSRNRTSTSASQENQAVWLGWNNAVRGTDSLAPPAAFTVAFPAAPRAVEPTWTVDLALAATDKTPPPRTPARDSTDRTGEKAPPAEDEEPDENEDDDDDDPIDLSVEVEDRHGRVARVALSDYGPIRRPLEIRILRRGDQERRRFQTFHDLVLQHYAVPFGDLLAANSRLDLAGIVAIRLRFDRSAAGTVVVDDIGLTRLPAAFTRDLDRR